MPPDADDMLSHGYQFYIKAPLGNEHLECMKLIGQKYKLNMNSEPTKELLFIYRRMEKKS